MTRLQILLGSLAFIAVWVLGKWLLNRRHGGTSPPTVRSHDDLDRWYRDAQERVAAMDTEERRQRIARWDSLTDREQLALAERFLRERFHPRDLRGLSRREILALGRTSEISCEDAEPCGD